jgi:putative transposase
MARQPRLLPAGYPVHVVHRAVNRARCFEADTDYLCYLHLLSEHVRDSACALHAYVLMSNHVHLLLTPDDERGVSLLMKNVAQRYAQYVNRSRNRTGALWEGRFKSSVVADDAYLLACHRYIDLNPVRAGMVGQPEEYAWSSHRANAGLTPNTLLRRHPVYLGLGNHDDACAEAYRRLFESLTPHDRTEEIRTALGRGVPLGRREYRTRFIALRHVATSRRPTGSDPKHAGVGPR